MFRFTILEVSFAVFLIWLASFVSTDTIPVPISVSPTKEFDGTDGNWSTFAIRVGNPAQNFRVLASTLVPETWVVMTQGCTTNSPSDCQTNRGNLFVPTASKSWEDKKTWSITVETNLGFDSQNAGQYGYDTLGVSTPTGGVVLDRQVVAGIATSQFYMGSLGLAAQKPEFNNQTQPSFLTALRDSKRIPSLSYSYTAGAHYNQTLGSLTLGGIDTSRFTPNSVAFQFAPDDAKYLSVGVQSVSFANGTEAPKQLAKTGFYALIDSTITPMWLPNDTCASFADAYGLKFDPLKLQYTISDEQHDKNVKNNPVVSFQLGNLISGGQTVAINFPYAAFDVYYSDPDTSDPTPYRYFPLRQASSPNQQVLGRTFLQEAFLTVDYERKNFSLMQALPASADAIPKLQAIASPADSTNGNGGSTTGDQPTSTSLTPVPAAGSSSPAGPIAGGVVGGLAVIAAVVAFVFFKKRKAKKAKKAQQDYSTTAGEKQPVRDAEQGDARDEKDGEYFGPDRAPGHEKGKPSVSASELFTPPTGHDATFGARSGHTSMHSPWELEGDPANRFEMDSKVTSMVSTATARPPGGAPSTSAAAVAAGGGALDPALESPGELILSQPAHDLSYFDPQSPQPTPSAVSRATSVGYTPVSGARMVDHRRGPSGSSAPASPRSPLLEQHPPRRQSSGSTHSTLIEGVSGRGSPGAANDSAFSSPRLEPGWSAIPPRDRSVSPMPPGHVGDGEITPP